METIMVAFRKSFTLEAIPSCCELNICADSRYIFYVNDVQVSAGPCRGSARDRYFDKVDIAPYLKKGDNLLFAKVIHYTEDPISTNLMNGAPVSIESTLIGGFLVEDLSGIGIQTNSSWDCREAKEYLFNLRFSPNAYIGAYENCDYRLKEEVWAPAVHQYDNKPYVFGGLANVWNIEPRPIPFVIRKNELFKKALVCAGIDKIAVEKLLAGEKEILVQPHSKISIEIDPETYQTGHPVISVSEGAGAKIRLVYTEKHRDDSREEFLNTGKYVDEVFDQYVLNGEQRNVEPFYYRAFRFLRVDIETEDNALSVNNIYFIKTSYPLEVSGNFSTDDKMLNSLWDVSLRTLICCMYETYMDCPFYEQMQYTMDTMLQMLYTYQVSSDDRLARKAIEDFGRSQLFGGMITCNAPSKIRQIIPGFSIYWVIMLHDHYKYYGDLALLRKHLPQLEKLLFYYENHTDKNTGLIMNTGYWQFVDWVKGWTLGQPTTNEDNYIYSMMVTYAYSLSSDIFKALGNESRAEETEILADNMRESIRANAFDSEAQLYREAPDMETESLHAQLWAVLAEVDDEKSAKELMARALDAELYPVSYCMLYFLLRAVEKTNLYHRTKDMWGEWYHHIETGSTTWPEDPVSNRSECHAWGSVPLYDFAACYLGVTPLEVGYEKVLIEPKALWLDGCEGKVATCRGDIAVKWEKKGNTLKLDARFENPMDVVVKIGNKEQAFFGAKECSVTELIGE